MRAESSPASRCRRAPARSRASNGCKSSSPLPDTDELHRHAELCAIATAVPPFAVPSSFVRATPVTSTASPNTRACWIPFWPVVASTTSSVSCGAPSRGARSRAGSCQLLHQVRLGVQPARPCRRSRSRALAPGGLDRVERDRRRVAAPPWPTMSVRSLRQISSCSSAAARNVSAAARDRVAHARQPVRELPDRRRLSRAVHSDDDNDRGRAAEGERDRRPPRRRAPRPAPPPALRGAPPRFRARAAPASARSPLWPEPQRRPG